MARSKEAILALVCGVIFGVGLLLSGMTHPNNVIGFLDVAGNWNPALAFVMGGAVITHGLLRRLLGSKPNTNTLPPTSARWKGMWPGVNPRLLIGASLFGIGWGISGFCPGPALVGLGILTSPAHALPVVTFVAAMWLGMRVYHRFFRTPTAR